MVRRAPSVKLDDSKRELAVSLDRQTFLCSTSNGVPIMWGVIVAQNDRAKGKALLLVVLFVFNCIGSLRKGGGQRNRFILITTDYLFREKELLILLVMLSLLKMIKRRRFNIS